MTHLPGIAFNKALIARLAEKDGVSTSHTCSLKFHHANMCDVHFCICQNHDKSDKALRQAILTFPQVVLVLSDKAGFSLAQSVRENPRFTLQVGYR